MYEDFFPRFVERRGMNILSVYPAGSGIDNGDGGDDNDDGD